MYGTGQRRIGLKARRAAELSHGAVNPLTTVGEAFGNEARGSAQEERYGIRAGQAPQHSRGAQERTRSAGKLEGPSAAHKGDKSNSAAAVSRVAKRKMPVESNE